MKLDAMLDRMKLNGGLQDFDAEYKSRRAAATAAGRGFMTYSQALARLKRCLIPSLAAGRLIGWPVTRPLSG